MIKKKGLKFMLLIFGALAFTACKKTELESSAGKTGSSAKMLSTENFAKYGLSLQNWMSTIPDMTSIAELSIPGTHESGAILDLEIGPVNFNNTTKCQNLTIPQQLQAGVRFLDIRCKRVNNHFSIYHEVVNQKQTFDEVIASCSEFLKVNPGETIIMSVKEEGEQMNSNREFDVIFREYVDKNPGLWNLNPEIPKLGNIRGKIKLLRRFKGKDMGIDATIWGDKATFEIGDPPKLKIQDEYESKGGGDSKAYKWKKMNDLWNTAKADKSDALYINFGSAYYTLGIASSNATKEMSSYINPLIMKLPPKGKYGIIPLDFIDVNLAAYIINTNLLLSGGSSITPKYNDGWNKGLSYPDGQDYDIWLPAQRSREKTRLFVFIHGGNFTTGDKTNGEYMTSVNAIKAEFPDCAIATINYTTGLSNIQGAIADVENAVKEIVKESVKMNISDDKIVLVGESAGAYLAFFEALRNDATGGIQSKYKAVVSLGGFANMLPEGMGAYNAVILGLAVKLDIRLIQKDIRLPGWLSWVPVFDPQADYKKASYKWSPVQWIPEREKIPELYIFHGKNDAQLEESNSRKIEEYVKKNPRADVRSKVFRKEYDDEGHTMSAKAKEDIAQILKERIKF